MCLEIWGLFQECWPCLVIWGLFQECWEVFRERSRCLDRVSHKQFPGLTKSDAIMAAAICHAMCPDSPVGRQYRAWVYKDGDPELVFAVEISYKGSRCICDFHIHYNEDGRITRVFFYPKSTVECFVLLKALSIERDQPTRKPMTEQQEFCLEDLAFYGSLGIPHDMPYASHFNHILPFRNTLKKLTLEHCGVDDRLFEAFLFEVLPKMPNLTFVDLRSNSIKSFRSIHQRLERIAGNPSDRPLSKLRDLWLYNSESELEDIRNPHEVCRFLREFSTIKRLHGIAWNTGFPRNMGYPWNMHLDLSSQRIQYELLLNWAGRSLVNGRVVENHPLPLSIWPKVLERPAMGWKYESASRKESSASLVFYLLREGPVFRARNG